MFSPTQMFRKLSRRPVSHAVAKLTSQCMFEPLEGRQMMSVTVVGETLFVEGTANNDSITVTDSGGFTGVNVNGQAQWLAATISTVYVNGYQGNDTIDIHAGSAKALVFAGPGNDIIHTGNGNDEIYGHEGDDTIASGNGNDLVDGGAGNDYIQGENGNDLLYGDGYNAGAAFGGDFVYGDDGDDTVVGGFGADVLQGNVGNDKLSYGERVGGATIYIFNNTNYQVTAEAAYRSGQTASSPAGSYTDGAGDIVYADFETIEGSRYVRNVTYNYGGPVTVTAGNLDDYFYDTNASSKFVGGIGEDMRNLNGVLQNLPYNDTIAQANGSRIEFEYFDEGGEGVSYHDNDATDWGANETPGGFHRSSTGVDSESGFVNFVTAGEWLEYTVNVPATGDYNLGIRGGLSAPGTMHMEVDGSNVTGNINVAGLSNSQYQTWTAKQDLHLTAGTHVIRMAFDAGGSIGWVGDFDYFTLTKQNPNASISGTFYNDADVNGSLSTGDTKLSGKTVFLDTNNNGKLDTGEKSTTTDSSGNYKFTGLAKGTYHVARVLPSGYRTSSPSTGKVDVTVTNSSIITGKNFGVTDRAKVSGTVFSDNNGNQLKDSSEGGLKGWRVYLDTNNNGNWDSGERSTLSDGSGNWSFDALAAGSYKARIVGQSNYSPTAPTSGVLTFSLAKAQISTGKLFGEQKIA